MLQHFFTRVGTAVLAAGIAWGTVGSASAAPPRHSGGHSGGHTGGHAGSFGGWHGGNHYHGGHTYYGRSYGGHNSYGRGYGYRYPYSNFGLGLNVGRLGYGYPRYYGGYYGYPAYSAYYGYPSYGVYSGDMPYYTPSYVGSDVAVAPAAPATSHYPPTEQAPPPASTSTAQLTVQVPAGARLWIDGQLTAQTAAVRSFETPTLDPGRTYSYKLVAEWVENGQAVTRERTVQFAAGNQAVVNLNVP